MALDLTFEHRRTTVVEFMWCLWPPERDEMLVVQDEYRDRKWVERWYRTRGRIRQDHLRHGRPFRVILANLDEDKIYCLWPQAGFYKEMPRWEPRPQFDGAEIGPALIDGVETVHHRYTSTNLAPLEVVMDFWWNPSGQGRMERICHETTKWCEGLGPGDLADMNVPDSPGSSSDAEGSPLDLPAGTYTVLDSDDAKLPSELFEIPSGFRLQGVKNEPARSVSDLVRQAITGR
jgi:hypothetical protein